MGKSMDDEEGVRGAPAGLPRAKGAHNDEGRPPLPRPPCADAVGPLHHQAAPDGPPPSAGIPPDPVGQSLEARSARPGEELRVTPNKNRLVQARRTGGRKLFDRKRKEVFLEWFAATCNVRLSAGKAGVHEKTVY